MEAVQRDFSKKGVQFYYIYKSLAHPETNGYITPFTLEERLLHVAEAKKKLGSQITWLCDTMTNDVKHALGDAPNSEFVVDPDGRLILSRRWSDPEELRADLEDLVGKVENPTSIAELGMKRLEPPQTAPKGIVARLQLPGSITPLQVEPSTELSLPLPPLSGDLVGDWGGEPLYVKLRAEVDLPFFRDGRGKLYLGFFLDPLYEVHWNNQVAPIEYEITAPSGLVITPLQGSGPTVEEKADADPREFLLDISGDARGPIQLTVKYFACDDAETFCKPVTQHYLITLQRDRDGGSRRGSGRRPGDFAGRPFDRLAVPDQDAEKRSQNLKTAVKLFREHDVNEDGELDKSEWARVQNAPADSDADSDGIVSLRELIDAINEQSADTASSGRAPVDLNGSGSRGGGRPNPAQMLTRMDVNGDGKVSKEEVPPPMLLRWDRMDTNQDGFIDKQELEQLATHFRRFSRD